MKRTQNNLVLGSEQSDVTLQLHDAITMRVLFLGSAETFLVIFSTPTVTAKDNIYSLF